jgi:CubicO group peptidase (beta-lactamase class C family)
MAKRFRGAILAATIALATGVGISGQQQSDRVRQLSSAFPEIDRLFSAFAERGHVPGITYGILIDGQLVHTGRAGVRELAGKTPVTDETVFRIASMTKSFTALCILKLRDEGKLALDDPAEKYVPELATLKYPTSDSPKLSLRHLMSHATGFPEDNPWGDQQLAVSEAEFTKMLAAGIPFSTSPGTNYEYSNYGFAILGRVVSRVSGMPYARYVTDNILKPLGMTSTTLDANAVPGDRLAHGYRWEDNQWKEEPPLPDGAFGSMGGMLTSTRDLGRYVAFLMSAWPARDGADSGPVKRSSLREMQQVQRPQPATAAVGVDGTGLRLNSGGYGYGLGIRQTCDYRAVVGHTGGLPGFGSAMRWLPDEGVGFISMASLTYTSAGGVIDQAIDVLARTGALTRRQPVPSAALLAAKEDVTSLITRWDDAVADRVAAVNLFMDSDKPHRRAQLDRYREQYGACRASDGIDAENALRGQWTMRCERGALRVAITLAPTMPPKIQYLNVTPLPPAAAQATARGCGQ